MNLPDVTPYGWLMLVGILFTAWIWGKLLRDRRGDIRLTIVYFAGLFGALLGAKLAFFAAEGWHHRGDWVALVSGRSITGALLLGYLAVEIAKKRCGIRSATGDLFALVVPMGIGLGRAGCILQGCCPGVICEPAAWTVLDAAGHPRWPSAHLELAFNLLFLAWVVLATRRNWLPTNRCHVYLIAYGAFRFAHEFLRDDVRLVGPLTGYHALALAVFALGTWRFRTRLHELRHGEAVSVVPAAGAQ